MGGSFQSGYHAPDKTRPAKIKIRLEAVSPEVDKNIMRESGGTSIVNELLSVSQRFEVASMLCNHETYLKIAEKTGASTATISRVNRSLNYGNDGYELVFARMKKNKESVEENGADDIQE